MPVETGKGSTLPSSFGAQITSAMSRAVLASVLLLVCGLGACSSRISIFDARPVEQAGSLGEELVFQDSVLQVGFEFWSLGGAPWITLVANEPGLYLDAAKSQYIIGKDTRQLDEGSFFAGDGFGFEDRFRDWERVARGRTRRTYVRVPQDKWAGFELPAMASQRVRRPGVTGNSERIHYLELDLAFERADGSVHRFRRAFTSELSAKISEREFDDYHLRVNSDASFYTEPDYAGTLTWVEIILSAIALSIAF